MTVQTKESQNQTQVESYLRDGGVCLGPWTSHIWRDDPRHLGFLLARYKFCAKMLTGRNTALEVGCGDAFGLPVVLQTVNEVHGVDFEPLVIDDAQKRLDDALLQRITLSVHDMTDGPVVGSFDAAYSLDVIEHIPTDSEPRFMDHLCQSLTQHSVCIIGTPNIEAHRFASPLTAEGHINLKSADFSTNLPRYDISFTGGDGQLLSGLIESQSEYIEDLVLLGILNENK